MGRKMKFGIAKQMAWQIRYTIFVNVARKLEVACIEFISAALLGAMQCFILSVVC